MAKKKVKKSEKVSPLSFLPKDVKSTEVTVVGLLEGKDGLYYPIETRIDLRTLKETQIALGKADLYEMGLDRCETALLGAKLTRGH
tara:strand:- start:390 stop:647 length:258 start_codon:yes stop_codon:yes gene_type:complete